MRSLGERQAEFAAALLAPEAPLPVGCVDPAGRCDARRFAVYRNNVVSSLIEAMEAAYPVVRRLLGEESFRAVARLYVLEEPPRSPIMLHYGERFADFLAGLEPLAPHPYLADVARIERAWLEAYHAADAEPLDPTVLANLPEQDATNLVLVLHPSVRLVRSAFPALTIWEANRLARPVPPIELGGAPEDVLIVRCEAEVEVRIIPAGGALFLQGLARGDTLAEAAAAALAVCSSFDLTGHLAALLGRGWVTDARWPRSCSVSNRKKVSPCH